MQNFKDTYEIRKQLFGSAFLICMAVPLSKSPRLQNLWYSLFTYFWLQDFSRYNKESSCWFKQNENNFSRL